MAISRDKGGISEFELAVIAEVKAWMGRRDISGRQLAKLVGISASNMSYRLTGKTAFTVNELAVIAGIFGINLVELLGSVATAQIILSDEDTENPAPAQPERGETDQDVRPVGLEPTTHGLTDPIHAQVAATTMLFTKHLHFAWQRLKGEAKWP